MNKSTGSIQAGCSRKMTSLIVTNAYGREYRKMSFILIIISYNKYRGTMTKVPITINCNRISPSYWYRKCYFFAYINHNLVYYCIHYTKKHGN